jgi:hypothetical protein
VGILDHNHICQEFAATALLFFRAGGGEYEPYYAQALPSETPIVKNLRLGRTRTVNAGQSIVLSIDPGHGTTFYFVRPCRFVQIERVAGIR